MCKYWACVVKELGFGIFVNGKLEFQNVTQYFLEICNVCEESDPDSPWNLKQVMQYFPAIGNNCAWSMNDITNIMTRLWQEIETHFWNYTFCKNCTHKN